MSQFPAVSVVRIFPSPTNPRKHFDEAALAELADSIGRHGVLQPVLLRPHPKHAAGHFEIVAGERRWRAAKAAKLAEIPATVRELSDAEVVEIQVVENLQRQDLHPLEEADGYEALLKCQHPDGAPYTVEEIAAKVGKSKSYVYQRMRLAAITGKAREGFTTGQIDAARALIIARLPDPEDQDEAFEWITGDGLADLSDARDYVRRNFMQGLAKPPFDVTAVYFHRGTRGAQPVGPKCSECPKRTLNQPHLFEDMEKGDFCTDTDCFNAKAGAHVELEAEKMRAKGKKVLTGEEAKKVFPSSYSDPRGGYSSLDSWCYEPRLIGGGAKWSDLLKGLKAEIVHVSWPYQAGEWRKVVNTKAALELLEAAGKLKAEPKAKPQSAVKQRLAEQDLRNDIELAVHKAVREAVMADQRGLRSPLAEGLLRVIAKELWIEREVDMEIQDFAVKDGKIDWQRTSEGELLAALVDAAIPFLDIESDLRRVIAGIYAVDYKAVEKKVRADAKSAAKAAEKPAKATKAKPEKPTAPKVTIVPLIKPLAKEPTR